MPIRSSIANSLRTFGADRVTNNMIRPGPPTIDYIMVGGGGGGGGKGGGGGGAGGLRVGSGYPVAAGLTLTVTVGGAGGGGGGGGDTGGNGNGSSIGVPGNPVYTTIAAAGGGGGGGGSPSPGGGQTGNSGGSGGGGGRDQSPTGPNVDGRNPNSAGLGNIPSVSPAPSQGNRGGRGGVPPMGAAGGGGGFGGTGQDGQSNNQYDHDNQCNGGDGRNISDFWGGFGYSYLNPVLAPANGPWTGFIMAAGGGNGIQTGSSGTLGGRGGSSSSIPSLYPRTGGDGGTGGGSSPINLRGNNATQHTGSGGGGGGTSFTDPLKDGGAGASGTVLIRYDEYYTNVSSTTGAVLFTSQNGYKHWHFYGTGSITFT